MVVQSDAGVRCTTPESIANVAMAVPLFELSESERLAGFQSATEQAIEELLLDVLLCLEGA